MVAFVAASVNCAGRYLRSSFALCDAFIMESVGGPTHNPLLVTCLLIYILYTFNGRLLYPEHATALP